MDSTRDRCQLSMNILILSTYPIKNPRHGGQLRVRNIVDKYINAGYDVQVIGVLGSDHYERENGFLPFPGIDHLNRFVKNPFLLEDYAIGQLFSNDDTEYQRLVSQIRVTPDVIHVEHPWLFDVAKRFVNSVKPAPFIIYSSHNIESKLKKEILLSYFDKSYAELIEQMVKAIELDAIKRSDVVICVSEDDAKWVKSNGDRGAIIAQNGVKPWNSTDVGRSEARMIVEKYSYALYCASAHPPNMTGFFDMFGGGFGSLKPSEKLVVAGSAGWSIAGDTRVHKSAKLAEKLVIAGMVSQCCLEGLLDMAHCIVLPPYSRGGDKS
jgi:hypothetical protein